MLETGGRERLAPAWQARAGDLLQGEKVGLLARDRRGLPANTPLRPATFHEIRLIRCLIQETS